MDNEAFNVNRFHLFPTGFTIHHRGSSAVTGQTTVITMDKCAEFPMTVLATILQELVGVLSASPHSQ